MISHMMDAHPSSAKISTLGANAGKRYLSLFFMVLTGFIAACVSPPPSTVTAPAATPAPVPVSVEVAPPPEPAPPAASAAPLPPPVAIAAPPKEIPLVDLPSYARRGKRLPADGGAPGRAVIGYCRSFEIEKDAASYFKRLQRDKQLPTEADIAERNRLADQSLGVQQYVARDWALRRDNNKSVPQRCKVLGGATEGATAHIVFEADLNGRRQRGTATVVLSGNKWQLRDHGDWSPVR